MVRDYLRLDLGDDEAREAELNVDVDAGEWSAEARKAREALRAAERAQAEAARKTRQVVDGMRRSGMTGADVAAVLGVSPQRVSQLLAKKTPRAVAAAEKSSRATVSKTVRGKAR